MVRFSRFLRLAPDMDQRHPELRAQDPTAPGPAPRSCGSDSLPSGPPAEGAACALAASVFLCSLLPLILLLLEGAPEVRRTAGVEER